MNITINYNVWQAAYISVMRNTSTINRHGLESILTLYRESDAVQEKTRILGELCRDLL